METDLFQDNKLDTTAFEVGKTIPTQTVAVNNDNEISVVAGKMGISFGVMFISIIIIILIALIIKKLKEQNIAPIEYEYVQETEEKEANQDETPIVHTIKQRVKKGTGELATPTNLTKCIRRFLENTRTKN